MRAPVTLCMISRDEPLLRDTLKSLVDHVSEIVVVDTAPEGDLTADICREIRELPGAPPVTYERYTACNDAEGRIADFANARQRSYDLATQPWILWADSDDVVVGAEQLNAVIEEYGKQWPDLAVNVLFKYEYGYDAAGRVTTEHYRERLCSRPTNWVWKQPVHEVYLPRPGVAYVHVADPRLVYKHRRHESKVPRESGRNLRILRREVERAGTGDARLLYYIGIECHENNLPDEAIKWLTEYVAKSGWDDEKALACIRLSAIYEAREDFETAKLWAYRAHDCKLEWGEALFALARLNYWQALRTPVESPKRRQNFERCITYARRGLSLQPTHSMLFVNPLDRSFFVHVYLNGACNEVGDVQGAWESAGKALEAISDDQQMLHNFQRYDGHLARQMVLEGLGRMERSKWLSPAQANAARRAVDGQGGAAWPEPKRPAEYPRGVTAESFPVALVTPHGEAWGVPEQADIDGLPLRTSDAQLEAMVVALAKEYVLHDELLAALNLLRDPPYRAKDSVLIEQMRRLVEGTLSWMHTADAQRVNAPADPTHECIPMPELLGGQLLERYEMIRARLGKGDRVLDLGCGDGAMTNRFGSDKALALGALAGADLCVSSVTIANKVAGEHDSIAVHHALEFDRASEYFAGTEFDVVYTADTYEHVPDAAEDMLRPAYEVLRPGGRLLLTTPHGAWMRGAFVEWAHPWRWAQEVGKAWICDESRAHVVAPTPWTVTADLEAAGFEVRDCYVALCKTQDVPGQGNVFAEAVKRARPKERGKLRVGFVLGDCWEPWTPRSVEQTGIGGSELAVIHMAQELEQLGHAVSVYVNSGRDSEGIYAGVRYRQLDKLELDGDFDVLVAWRNAQLLKLGTAPQRLLWVHDVFAGGADNATMLLADRVLALSKWHKDYLCTMHRLHPDHVIVTRNGIELERFVHLEAGKGRPRAVPRNPRRAIYSSSPDRGLQALLQMWPRIREQVPDAELRVFYGFEGWKKSAQLKGAQDELSVIAQLEARLKELEPMGVSSYGRVTQRRLTDEFLAAGAWLYPTWFSETSCITAMEVQAAGLRIVTSPIAALPETVGLRGQFVEGDWLSPEYQDKFVALAVQALIAPENDERQWSVVKAANNFSWSGVASAWVKMFEELARTKHDDPLVPYQPHPEWLAQRQLAEAAE